MSQIPVLLLKPVTMKLETGSLTQTSLNEVTPQPGNVINEYTKPELDNQPCYHKCWEGVDCYWPGCKSPGNQR